MNRDSEIWEALVTDKGLEKLYDKRREIYSIATPTVILNKSIGVAGTVWIDDKNNPILSNIEELIELRIQQIKQTYEK